MNLDLAETMEILGRTPVVLDTLLRGIGPEWHDRNEGEGTWRPRDVVGHLVHGEETDWIPRARLILEHGETREFVPFDRFAQFDRFAGWSLDRLLDRFSELRRDDLRVLAEWRLTPDQLELRGRHPAFGTVTLGQLVATWAVHDLNHIGQIVRVMAKRYSDEVGPWRAYLSILNR